MKFLHEWYQYREMFIGLVGREVRLRYRGSVLGLFWTLLNPLMQMVVYSLVFAVFMRIDVPNYSVFVFCSLLPWTWFANSITTASDSIASSAGLVKKIYFPTELLPLVCVTSQLINFLFAFPVLLAFLLYFHAPVTWAWLVLPIVIGIQFLFTAALAMLFAMLNTFYRDVQYLLGILLMVWFYLTPVLYPIHMMPERILAVLAFNPMLHLVQAYRSILLEGNLPSWNGLSAAFFLSLVLFLCIYPLFNRYKYQFAEVV